MPGEGPKTYLKTLNELTHRQDDTSHPQQPRCKGKEIYGSLYSSLAHVQKSAVRARDYAAFDGPFARLACQRAIEAVLYGYYVDEGKFFREGGTLQGRSLDSVKKDNLSDVSVGIFADEKFAWLSAVVFSSCASWGKVRALSADPNPNIFFESIRLNATSVIPHVVRTRKTQYSESLLDGLRVYHNPSATHKLGVATFRHPDVFQELTFSEKDGEWMHDQRDGLSWSIGVGLTGISKPPGEK